MAKAEPKVISFEETYRKIEELASFDISVLKELAEKKRIDTETLDDLIAELETLQKSIDKAQELSDNYQNIINSLDLEKIDFEDLDPETYNADVRALQSKALSIVSSIEEFVHEQDEINKKSKEYKERIAVLKKSIKELNDTIATTNEKYEEEYQRKTKSAILRSYLEAGNVSFLPSSKELLDFMFGFKNDKGKPLFETEEFCNIIDIFMLKKRNEKLNHKDGEQEGIEITVSDNLAFDPFAPIDTDGPNTAFSPRKDGRDEDGEKSDETQATGDEYAPTFIDIDSIEGEEHDLSDEKAKQTDETHEEVTEPELPEQEAPSTEEEAKLCDSAEQIISFGKSKEDVALINEALTDVTVEHVEKVNAMFTEAGIDLKKVSIVVYTYLEEEIKNYLDNLNLVKEFGIQALEKYPVTPYATPGNVLRAKLDDVGAYGVRIESAADLMFVLEGSVEHKIATAIEMGSSKVVEDLKKYPISKIVFPSKDKVEEKRIEMREALESRFEGTGVLKAIDSIPITDHLGMDEFQKLIDLQTRMLTTICDKDKSVDGCYVIVDSDGKEIAVPKSRVNENLQKMVAAKFDKNTMDDDLMLFLSCVYRSARDYTDAIELETIITKKVGREL